MELTRRYYLTNQTMNDFKIIEHEYNQTDVIIRYFNQEKENSIFFTCNGIEEAKHYLCGKSYPI